MLGLALVGGTTGCGYSEVFPDLPGSSLDKVLFLGLDGCCPDALIEVDNPDLNDLKAIGSYSFKAQTENHPDTISGPGWSSIFTGTWSDQHHVHDNEFTAPNYAQYPSFFTRARKQKPEMYTCSLANWSPINTYINKDATVCYRTNDYGLAEAACWALNNRNPDLLSLCFDDIDAAGHRYGFHRSSPKYLAAIERICEYIGFILEALTSRPTYNLENWLIVCTTDHGGYANYDDKGNIVSGSHCGGLEESRTIFYLSNKPGGEIIPPPTHIDLAPTILHHLGIPFSGLEGRIL